jgi:hypothetical protein
VRPHLAMWARWEGSRKRGKLSVSRHFKTYNLWEGKDLGSFRSPITNEWGGVCVIPGLE